MILLIDVINCEEIKWEGLGSMMSGIAAILALFFGGLQLLQIKRSLKDSNVMKVLEIEFEIVKRYEALIAKSADNIKYLNELPQTLSGAQEDKVNRNDLDYMVIYLSFLSILERLSKLILEESLKSTDFKESYQDLIRAIVSKNERGKFNPGSKYVNILRLNSKWKEENEIKTMLKC